MLNWWRSRRDDPEELLARGDVERAMALLLEHLESKPEDVAARRLLAEALEQSGREERAVEVLFELTEDLANDGHVTQSFAVLKDVERMASSPEMAQDAAPDIARNITERAWALMKKAAGRDAEAPFKTSEIVLEDWLPAAEQRGDFLASPLFQDLGRRELTQLFDELRLRRKHAGAVIYAAGQPSRGLYVLARGAVRLYRPMEDHRLQQVALLEEGDLFGISGVLGEGRRRYTVTAAGHCEILEIDRGIFDRLAAVHPALLARVRAIAREQREAEGSDQLEPPWSHR